MRQSVAIIVQLFERCFVLLVILVECPCAVGEEPLDLIEVFSTTESEGLFTGEGNSSMYLAPSLRWTSEDESSQGERQQNLFNPGWRGSLTYLLGDQNGGLTDSLRDEMDWDTRIRIGSGISFSLEKSGNSSVEPTSNWKIQGLYFGSQQYWDITNTSRTIIGAFGDDTQIVIGQPAVVISRFESFHQKYQSHLGSLSLNRKLAVEGKGGHREYWIGLAMGYQGERLRRSYEHSPGPTATEFPTARSRNLMIGPNLGIRQTGQWFTRLPVEAFANVGMMYNRSTTHSETNPYVIGADLSPLRSVSDEFETKRESSNEFSLASAIGVRAGWQLSSNVAFQTGVQHLRWSNQNTVFSYGNATNRSIVAIELGMTAQY